MVNGGSIQPFDLCHRLGSARFSGIFFQCGGLPLLIAVRGTPEHKNSGIFWKVQLDAKLTMAIRKIARMGHPVLKSISRPVEDPSAPEIARLAQDLIDTCEDIGGNGIAAPQIYVPVRMFAYRVRADVVPDGAAMQSIPWTIVINPTVEPVGGETKLYWERCLSLPGLYGQVPRYRTIRFSYVDLTGESASYISRGFHARLLQHEFDHLDGYLYPMRMRDLSTLGFVSELGPPAYPNLPRDAEDFVDPEYE